MILVDDYGLKYLVMHYGTGTTRDSSKDVKRIKNDLNEPKEVFI